MPQINPIEKSLLGINRKFKVSLERAVAKESKVIPFGMEKLDPGEIATRIQNTVPGSKERQALIESGDVETLMKALPREK